MNVTRLMEKKCKTEEVKSKNVKEIVGSVVRPSFKSLSSFQLHAKNEEENLMATLLAAASCTISTSIFIFFMGLSTASLQNVE